MNSCAPRAAAAMTRSSASPVGERDILAHRTVEQDVLLRDDADLAAQPS
jgi:hypothetical protein